MAEQIANQLQRKEQPKALLDKKELVRAIPRALLLAMTLRWSASLSLVLRSLGTCVAPCVAMW